MICALAALAALAQIFHHILIMTVVLVANLFLLLSIITEQACLEKLTVFLQWIENIKNIFYNG